MTLLFFKCNVTVYCLKGAQKPHKAEASSKPEDNGLLQAENWISVKLFNTGEKHDTFSWKYQGYRKKNVIHMTYLSARTFSNCLILWNIFLSNIVLQKGYTVKRLWRAFS